ncbi:MAG: hypothetical protein ABSE42_21650 [Bryobacteraceae bacterium]|jgi:hypothetical protein
MRLLLLVSLAGPLAFAATEPLAVVQPVISQMEEGAASPAGFYYTPGEILFFTCRVAHYAKTADLKVQIGYSVEAFDPKGVQITETYKNEFKDEVTVEDKDWMPKIQTQVMIPSLAGSGIYKIVVKAEDVLGKTTAQVEVPFEVRGRVVEPSEKLIVRNFRFYHDEEGKQPAGKAVYHAGQTMWTRFDVIGYQYGPGNKVDVSYVASIMLADGKVLWKQPEPAVEQSQSFYPKRYISGEFSINMQASVKPGSYLVGVQVKDAVGNQIYESRQPFTVE